jgi:hypothetical protein
MWTTKMNSEGRGDEESIASTYASYLKNVEVTMSFWEEQASFYRLIQKKKKTSFYRAITY